MKKPINYIVWAIIALTIPLVANAQTSALVAGETALAAPAQTAPATTDQTVTPIVEPLTVRKATAEKNLRAIQAQFALFATRTQSTIDRLRAKNIDTTKAQAELALTNTALGLSQTNLDLFAKIVVTDDTPETDTAELKLTLTKIEESLKEARAHLINSLTELKASVETSIGAQIQ